MSRELTTREKINSHLLVYGIKEHVEIEEGAEDWILTALETEGVNYVYLDKDGSLVIEYND